MNTYRPFFLLLLALWGLTSSSIVPEIVINPKSLKNGDLQLSDLIERIEYIPLETHNKCFIGRVAHYDISENYILVSCPIAEKVYLFNKKGKFLRQISEKGQGPGEYMYISNVFIRESDNEIVLKCSGLKHEFLYFDLKGKYIRSQTYPDMGWTIAFQDNRYISGNFIRRSTHTFELHDKDLNVLTYAVKPIPTTTMYGIPPFVSFYKYSDNLYIRETTLNDTVYQIKNNQFLPVFRINIGKYEVTAELKNEPDRNEFFKGLDSRAVLTSLAETENNLLFSYRFTENNHFGYYNKLKKELLYFQSDKGIPNDYNGGIAFWPDKQINKTCYAFYEAPRFEDELNEQKQFTPKGPKEAIAAFDGLMKKLDPEDNPVLVIVKLK